MGETGLYLQGCKKIWQHQSRAPQPCFHVANHCLKIYSSAETQALCLKEQTITRKIWCAAGGPESSSSRVFVLEGPQCCEGLCRVSEQVLTCRVDGSIYQTDAQESDSIQCFHDRVFKNMLHRQQRQQFYHFKECESNNYLNLTVHSHNQCVNRHSRTRLVGSVTLEEFVGVRFEKLSREQRQIWVVFSTFLLIELGY